MRGKMWRVIKEMYSVSRSAVLLDGECSEVFDVEQGVAQGCSLSPISFSVFINGLLKEVEQAGFGVELSTIGGFLFADAFVGVSNSEEELQRLINVAHAYCCKWRLRANVSKSAVVVFARELVEGSWNWGEQDLPKFTYIGVDFTSNGAWDEHVKRVLQNGRKNVSQVHSNRDTDSTARSLLLISVVRQPLE